MKTQPITSRAGAGRHPAKASESGHRVAPARPEYPLRLLLADDSAAVRVTTRLLLCSQGFSVVEAGSGEEAVALYRELGATIELVMLDMQMPGMDGLDTLRALRGLDSSVRVVMVSGGGRTERVERALREGALAFVPKPFSFDDLLADIAQWVAPARDPVRQAMAG